MSVDAVVVLDDVACCRCGVANYHPKETISSWQRHKKALAFYCWNCGVQQGWPGRTTEQDLRDQVARLQNTADNLREQRDHQERRVRSVRGHLTRTKGRVANGVCPCCKRTFRDLADHMKAKHPAYAKESTP